MPTRLFRCNHLSSTRPRDRQLNLDVYPRYPDLAPSTRPDLAPSTRTRDRQLNLDVYPRYPDLAPSTHARA
jgi:hypothetical protein